MTRSGYDVPPEEFDGRNLDELPAFMGAESYGVAEWTPERDGKGKPTAVMVWAEFGEALDGLHIGIRVKSREELNRLIVMLKRHRDGVWPVPRSQARREP